MCQSSLSVLLRFLTIHVSPNIYHVVQPGKVTIFVVAKHPVTVVINVRAIF